MAFPLPTTRRAACALHALFIALCLGFALTGCRHALMADPAAPSQIIVVRHAEKKGPMSDTDADPALTAAGEARAERLARSLDGLDVVAVYSTPYRRTRQTAGPAASAHRLPITGYDAREPAPALAAAVRERHPTGTVLIVGHSNTVPDIVAALCDCEVAPMDETEYEHRFFVEFDADGRARMSDRPLPP